MAIQNLWPLAFLALIPVILLLYILRQKAKDQVVSSDMLWQEVYRNLEAKTPFEKLKNNLLMYLQILLLLLLILALMAPVWKRGGETARNLILVMDTSASMLYQYDDADTRLDYCIKEAQEEVDAAGRSAIVTIISCGSEASIVYQGSDTLTIKARLRQLYAREEAGTLDVAVPLVNSVASGLENVSIYCYTDTEFSSKDLLRANEDASLSVVSAYSEKENCSVDSVSYGVDSEGITVLCHVTNHGSAGSSQDISLYVDQQIASVQPLELAPGESRDVYFDPVPAAVDGSVVVRAELSETDALPQDNMQQTAVTAGMEKRVLLFSKGNVFLEKSLGLNEGVSVYKADDLSVLDQTEDVYDLYVFDGDIFGGTKEERKSAEKRLAKLPENAALLFLDQPQDVGGFGGIILDGEEENAVLSFQDTGVTRYITDVSFGMTKVYRYQLPEWAQPIIRTAKGGVCAYFGRRANDDKPGSGDAAGGHNGNAAGRMTAVLGFDLHNSDLALKTEFPIFMSQLTDALLTAKTGAAAEVTNFPTDTESDVTAAESIETEGSGAKVLSGGRSLRNLILLLVLLLLVAEWIVYVRQVHSSKKKQYLPVRLLVGLAVILAICGLSVTLSQKKAQTIFLVDVSDSMSGNIADMEKYLRETMAKMPDQNSSAVVLFGRNTAVDAFMTTRKVFSKFTAQPVTSATNIEQAVKNACSMFDEGAAKHLVLLTDGSENEGSLSLSAATVKNQDVELSVIEMEDSISRSGEVYVSDLSLPSVIHNGDHYNVTVSVESNVETDARLLLYAGRSLKGQQEVHLTIGTNQFVFEDTAGEETIAQYKAVIEAEKDTFAVNNTYAAFAEVEAKPRLLLVEGRQGEASEFEKVLQAIGASYDCVTPSGVPATVAQLNQYKAVITLDVYYDDLRKGFAQALGAYVRDYAGGYICIGGDNSYALGNYRGTVLEDILPVSMDMQGEKEIPKMAMVMVLDQSGSMMSPAADDVSLTCLTLAKQAAMAGSSQLRETDEIGVLSFDDVFRWVVPLRAADDPQQIESQIESIAGGGGTSIYPALQEAYLAIAKSDAKLKHIILLTDGQDGFHDYEDLLEKINAEGITVSTVAVGEGADQDTLSWIANECGGRYYYSDMNHATPRIFAQEVYLATDTYLVNGEFYPAITSGNEILTGVFDSGMPAILGYIAATPKQTSDVILASEQGDPILSTWQCGLGRTVAWNSDGTNEWTAQFAAWENYPLLWSNIINYVIADTSLGDDSLEIAERGLDAGGPAIVYETREYGADTKVTAVVTDENGDAQEITLDAVKPGVFQGSPKLTETGVYSVSVRKYAGDQLKGSFNTAYANQYSAEYQFSDAGMDLAVYAAQCGGKVIRVDDDVWNTSLRTVKRSMPIAGPLLIFAIFLWLADIALRRLSVDILAVFGRAGRRIVSVFKPIWMALRACVSGPVSRGSAGKREDRPHRNRDRQRENRIETRREKRAASREPEERLDMEQLLQKKRDRGQ